MTLEVMQFICHGAFQQVCVCDDAILATLEVHEPDCCRSAATYKHILLASLSAKLNNLELLLQYK